MDGQVNAALPQGCDTQLAATRCQAQLGGEDGTARTWFGEIWIADETEFSAKPSLGVCF
jgi:hypothetical protein